MELIEKRARSNDALFVDSHKPKMKKTIDQRSLIKEGANINLQTMQLLSRIDSKSEVGKEYQYEEGIGMFAEEVNPI